MTKDDTEIVSAILAKVADRVGKERYSLWFGADTRLGIESGALRVFASSRFKLDWLRQNFRDDMKVACKSLLGTVPPIEYLVDATLACAKTDSDSQAPGLCAGNTPTTTSEGTSPTTQAASVESEKTSPGKTRRRFSKFDQFVVGDANRIAYSSSRMVVCQPGELSPFFIHGAPGLGKTHLLESIWCEARQSRRFPRMVYLTAEQFTVQFMEAMHGRSGMPNFRRKYRDLDLLILDDVQFIAGKPATMDELLHTIDTIMRRGGQMVFAGTKNPDQISGLGDELSTRLGAGLVCGLRTPDAAARIEILRRFAARDGLDVPGDVLNWIGTNITQDVRRLSGALCRLKAAQMAWNRPVTLDMAQEALDDLVRANSPSVRLADVQKAVCDTFGLEPDSLHSNRKGKAISNPRMLAMWLARKYTRVALTEISHFFGRRSHTTVLSAEKKVGRWVADGESIQLADKTWDAEEAVRQVERRLLTG